jgi:hypothetical protein
MVQITINIHSGSNLPENFEININFDNLGHEIIEIDTKKEDLSDQIESIYQKLKPFDIEKHLNTEEIGKKVYIVGPSTSGKTELVKQITNVTSVNDWIIVSHEKNWKLGSFVIPAKNLEADIMKKLHSLKDGLELNRITTNPGLVVEDFPSDKKCFNNKFFEWATSQSQIYKLLYVQCVQSFLHMPNAQRINFSYVILCKGIIGSFSDWKKIHRELGSFIEDYKVFKSLCLKIFENHNYIVISKMSESLNIEDKMFYF